jgi:hypothetical protein
MKTISTLILSLGIIGCASESSDKSMAQHLAFETIIQDGDSFPAERPWPFVIQSKHEEEGFLSTSHAMVDFPEIDYSSSMVICLLSGRQDQQGVRVSIDSVVQYSDVIRVYSHRTRDTGDVVGESYPAHVIVLDKVRLPVEFIPDPVTGI